MFSNQDINWSRISFAFTFTSSLTFSIPNANFATSSLHWLSSTTCCAAICCIFISSAWALRSTNQSRDEIDLCESSQNPFADWCLTSETLCELSFDFPLEDFEGCEDFTSFGFGEFDLEWECEGFSSALESESTGVLLILESGVAEFWMTGQVTFELFPNLCTQILVSHYQTGGRLGGLTDWRINHINHCSATCHTSLRSSFLMQHHAPEQGKSSSQSNLSQIFSSASPPPPVNPSSAKMNMNMS